MDRRRGAHRRGLSRLASSARAMLNVGLLAVAILLGHAPSKGCAASSLAAVLNQLAAKEGFSIQGLAQVAGLPAAQAEGKIQDQLEALLSAFDHVIVLDGEGRVSLVVIGRHRAALAEAPVMQATFVPATAF